MIRAQLFRTGAPPTTVDLEAWTQVRNDPSEEVTIWVDVTGDDAAEVDHICQVFGLHDRAVELARRTDHQPTVRFYEGHYLATVLAINVDESLSRPRTNVTELDAFVGANFVVTIHRQPLPFQAELDERTATNPYLGRLDASYLFYAILDTLVGHYAREIDQIEQKVERLEDELLRNPGDAALGQALVLKRHIQRVRRLIAPHREALGTLVGADAPIEDERVEMYLRDLLRRLTSVIERIDHLRDLTTGAFNLYISSISNRTNQQLRVLTFLSAVLLPITAVAGIFGTNFQLAAYETVEPYYAMLAGTGIIIVGMLVFFRRQRWL